MLILSITACGTGTANHPEHQTTSQEQNVGETVQGGSESID